MGRPPSLVRDCQEVRDGMLQRGILAGHRIPRERWDVQIARLIGGSDSQVRNFTRTGKLHGFWLVHVGHGPGNTGYVELVAPEPEPVMASSTSTRTAATA